MNHDANWQSLLRDAVSLIEQTGVIDHWTFGGGTAMMIQIDHRVSHDVDIFIDDPQLLPFLDLAKHDYTLSRLPTDYRSDGARFSKIAFEGIGEIDFIVSAAMTETPYFIMPELGEEVKIERIAEIIAKKIHYRGRSIKPRDIFDIAAAARDHESDVIAALATMKREVEATIATMNKLKPPFVHAAIGELAIKDSFKGLAGNAPEIAHEILLSALNR